MTEVRAKKALGQHFLTDQKVARAIVDALHGGLPTLEVGPGMGVLTQYLLEREDIDLRLIEIDSESVEYLLSLSWKSFSRKNLPSLAISPTISLPRSFSRCWTTRTTSPR